MKLIALDIHGFKSFADRTTLKFDEGVSGIVGPNGCGKSNVIDAFRWVLGAQRTTQLRSDKMENVIFNGTAKRKRSNLASVSITFENTKNILPTEYSTVTVTRKLYRDGESEYKINDVNCRLKDIDNLFMDTGIGPDSYSIIELGMVDDILKDKNNARRVIFEEAAGIGKYKTRKKETLNRLNDTDQSLERVEDYLEVIGKNVRSLERQAKKAEKYFALKDRFRQRSILLAYHKGRSLEENTARVRQELDQLTQEDQKLETCLRVLETEILEREQRQLKQEEALSEYQKQVNAKRDELTTLENNRKFRDEKHQLFLQEIEELSTRQQELTDENTRLQKAQESLEAAIDEANELYDKADFELNQLTDQLEELSEAKRHIQRQAEEAAETLRSKEKRFRELEKQQGFSEMKIQSLEAQLAENTTDSEARSEKISAFDQDLDRQQKELAETEDKLHQLRNQRQKLQEELAENQQAREHTASELQQLQRKADALQNEYQLVKSLVEKLEGFPESIKFLARKKTWAKNPVLLSDLFTTGEPYRQALETLLEPYLNYFVVSEEAEALKGIRLLKDASKGRANFFFLRELRNQPPPPASTANLPVELEAIPFLELTDYDEHVEPLARMLLQDCYLLPKPLPEGFSAAQLQNITLVYQDGTTVLRPRQASGGSVGLFEGKRVGRAKNLENIAQQLKKLEAKINDKAETARQLEQQHQWLEQQMPEDAIEEARLETEALRQGIRITETKRQEYENYLKQLQNRGENLRQELERLKTDANQQTPDLEALARELDKLQTLYREKQLELEELSKDLGEVTQKHTETRIQHTNYQNRVGNLKTNFKENRERLQLNAEKIEQEKARKAEKQTALEALLAQDDTNDEEIAALYEAYREMEQELEKMEAALQETKHNIRLAREESRETRTKRDKLAQQLEALKNQEVENRMTLNAELQKLELQLSIKVEALSAKALQLEPEPEPIDAEELKNLQEEVNKVQRKLQNFGEVNTGAVEEYREVKAQYDQVAEERDDLLKAKADLLDIIQEIDETARNRFLETFDKVRENFQQVFKTLFTEQDSCDLLLLDPDNPLESKIEVTAKPKGKRPLTISQLSGGEKTLTATSLLFAVYLIKPAPFCIFDEVDAPLDDANIDKFNNIIREFSRQSQFILVTHNKRTMTKTNVMYGISMEEAGVSKVVPVSLRELNLN